MPFAPAPPPRLSRLSLAFLVSLQLVLVAVPGADSAARECTRADISVRLRLDRFRYDRGEPVRMKMTVKNVSRLRCKMVWNDGNWGSLVVRRENGRRVWWDEGCAVYTQAIVEERWRRGHTESYRGTWRQRTAGDPDTCEYDGRRARRGLYFARGIFEGAGDVRSNRVWFRLRG